MNTVEPYPLSPAERAVLQRRTAACIRLLAHLADYQAEVRQPCRLCGCVLFAAVPGGVRCLHCWPPLDLPERLRQIIEESMR